MAISQTMSNPSDWLFQQPYQNNDFSHINQTLQTPPTTTTPTAAAFSAAAAARANGSSSSNLSPEQGRVAKPVRRRSRASRRTPTTLLNTDTANFRAMVQHFTGGPAAAASSSVSFAARQQQIVPGRGRGAVSYMDQHHAAAAAPGGFHVQYPSQMFVMDSVHGGGGGGAPPHAAAGSGNRINYDQFMV
ncbi:VQ motif-containing protein 22 [Salvia miltiorrhiza]|uniref:VQ motif-containing protein 22 n=1 Tax=Salvia miltiorrhiza TaxID=226208 RepID=UPI0025AD4A90|nr:VQ motif-containing protein 22 [Salvia miltiorrhiza]